MQWLNRYISQASIMLKLCTLINIFYSLTTVKRFWYTFYIKFRVNIFLCYIRLCFSSLLRVYCSSLPVHHNLKVIVNISLIKSYYPIGWNKISVFNFLLFKLDSYIKFSFRLALREIFSKMRHKLIWTNRKP